MRHSRVFTERLRAAVSASSLALLAAAAPCAHAADPVVPFDLASATLARRLPFDVPFVLEGTAPPGTSRVSLDLRVTRSGGSDAASGFATAAVSGTDLLGRFRLAVPAIPADRTVELQVTVERSLSENGRRLFRLDAEALLRNELAPGRATEPAEPRLRAGLLAAFRRGLSEGRAAGEPPGERTLATPHVLFDPEAAPDQAAAELARLSRELRAARDELERAQRRHDDALASLSGALAEIAADGALDRVLAGLQASPELDPRNPRSAFALSDEARALASGRPPEAPPIAGAGPAQVAAAREAHRRCGRAIRELRDFAQAITQPGSPERAQALAAGPSGAALAADSLAALSAVLARGAFRRAESWASVLEDYTADAERALAAGDRALATLLADVEAAAAAVVVRERVTTRGSTAAGLYASLDLGVLYGFEADSGAAYAAFSLSLAPVNRAAPLRGAALRRRLSVIVGLTLTDMKKDGDERFENLIGDRWNVVAGLGVRVTGSLRVGAGALLLLKNDPNPLVTDRALAAVPYVSASLDVDVGRLFGGGER